VTTNGPIPAGRRWVNLRRPASECGREQPGGRSHAKGRDATGEHNFEVVGIARVEGEGTLRLRVTDGEVREARLSIFEAPRYFEKLVVGRTPNEVVDIVARICGICPVAYQMGASMAFEHLFEVEIDPQVRALRKLFYWGEWIESHALHVYMLHAPDFLGYESAIAMARDHKPVVEQALRLKRTGNEIMKLIGGRAIHPVSMRVGGFSRTPSREQIAGLREPLTEALALSQATLKLVAAFKAPRFERDPLYVAVKHPIEYGLNEGRIVSTDGIDVPLWGWREAFREEQHEGSNALHARVNDGRTYMLGPSARVTLNADQLHPLAQEALKASGLAQADRPQPVLVHRGPVGGADPRLGRRAGHRQLVRGAGPALHAVDATGRRDGLGLRGAARHLLAPLRPRRPARSRRPRSSPQPARTRA
jgi:sulfhydrogenase subunit alpha